MARKNPLRLRDRSTGDLLVLLIAGTITFVLVTITSSTIVFVFVYPESRPVDEPAVLITNMVNTLIGLLAGFMVGRTRTVVTSGTDTLTASSDNSSEFLNTSGDPPDPPDPLETHDRGQ